MALSQRAESYQKSCYTSTNFWNDFLSFFEKFNDMHNAHIGDTNFSSLPKERRLECGLRLKELICVKHTHVADISRAKILFTDAEYQRLQVENEKSCISIESISQDKLTIKNNSTGQIANVDLTQFLTLIAQKNYYVTNPSKLTNFGHCSQHASFLSKFIKEASTRYCISVSSDCINYIDLLANKANSDKSDKSKPDINRINNDIINLETELKNKGLLTRISAKGAVQGGALERVNSLTIPFDSEGSAVAYLLVSYKFKLGKYGLGVNISGSTAKDTSDLVLASTDIQDIYKRILLFMRTDMDKYRLVAHRPTFYENGGNELKLAFYNKMLNKA